MLAVAAALGSSLCWGVADFLGGLQARRRALLTVLLVSQAGALVLALAFVAAAGDALPDAGAVAWAVGAGFAGSTALAAFYRGLAIGTMSIVAPISASGAAVPVLVGLAGGERPGGLQVAGIVLAMAGIVLAAREPGEKDGEPRAVHASVLLALAAAAGFGSFFVCLDQATETAGVAWTLVLIRTTQVAALGAVAIALRPAMPEDIRSAAPLLLVGVLDVTANAGLAFATTEGLLSVVSVLGSLYPAVTVVLARFVLHERVSRLQEAGMVAILAGVVAISAGG